MRILLAEDEKHLNENIKKVLKKNIFIRFVVRVMFLKNNKWKKG